MTVAPAPITAPSPMLIPGITFAPNADERALAYGHVSRQPDTRCDVNEIADDVVVFDNGTCIDDAVPADACIDLNNGTCTQQGSRTDLSAAVAPTKRVNDYWKARIIADLFCKLLPNRIAANCEV
jgi:hypothetical protein